MRPSRRGPQHHAIALCDDVMNLVAQVREGSIETARCVAMLVAVLWRQRASEMTPVFGPTDFVKHHEIAAIHSSTRRRASRSFVSDMALQWIVSVPVGSPRHSVARDDCPRTR